MIDINYSFTDDIPGYWDHFWENNNGLGAGNYDPDVVSKTLQKYHQELWSRFLPNGERMDLKMGGDESDYLTWNGFRFGSDSILVSFRYEKCRGLLNQVEKAVLDYHQFVEDFVRRTYTIGGMMIFPKHARSINQMRGCRRQISDRFDLTLECIRRYYLGETSPLDDVLKADKKFFDLFVNFQGFVDYFFLQDLVTEDYTRVRFFTVWQSFDEDPIPKTTEKYLEFIEKELEFLEKRNRRIADYCDSTTAAILSKHTS